MRYCFLSKRFSQYRLGGHHPAWVNDPADSYELTVPAFVAPFCQADTPAPVAALARAH
jgi:hypothetical protein